MTRKKNYKPGDIVWTRGMELGHWYECTVIGTRLLGGKATGEYDLESPSHGYVITRHYSEIERSPT